MQILRALFIAILMMSSALALSEGEDYIVLKKPIENAQNSVIEAFSYSCIHCFNQHKQNTLGILKSKLPNLSFKAYPVKQMGAFGNEFAMLYAYANAQDNKNKLDVTDAQSLMHRLNDAYFTAYFERRMPLNDRKNIKAFYDLGLKVLNISQNELESFMKTAAAQALYTSYNAALEPAQNTGTPSFIVNGKYQVKLDKISSLEQFIAVISELSKK